MILRLLAMLVMVLSGAAAAAAQQAAPPVDNCRTCHAQLDGKLGEPAQQFADDVHATRGFTCANCHGGDPREEDMEKSMSRTRGFRGAPKRSEIPQLCAKCHSDGAFMRAYNPSLRTDQLAQYQTSVHGKRLSSGDARVAVCSDCHGVHKIRPASSPISNVHPQQIPNTCGRCHADAGYMKPYKIRTDQLLSYQASVHFDKLKGGDLAAPTCVTCHGNHGATPPGVTSVERVCGTCHVFQEQLFDQSPHKDAWAKTKIPSCLTCHGNHAIKHTSDTMVGTGKESICMTCHVEGDNGGKAAGRIYTALTGLDASLGEALSVVDTAERKGMEVGEARVTLSAAREKLIKARVDLHTMDGARVEETTKAGEKLSKQANQDGVQALAEYTFRRKGLALSLLVIAFVVVCLWLLIRNLERPAAGEETERT
ncbi:MAG: cytochrome c3 family protein [Acidobacteria bacterium]|nr:cytochrome c3 family protein [Acidobacteriota bacterium]MBI3661572.1 cytochrome c3 family protein [Acidobacteriota bacterium]